LALREERLEAVAEDSVEEPVPIAEVVVQRRRLDAGALADGSRRDRLALRLVEERRGGEQHLDFAGNRIASLPIEV
jgi:hypothetical protein